MGTFAAPGVRGANQKQRRDRLWQTQRAAPPNPASTGPGR